MFRGFLFLVLNDEAFFCDELLFVDLGMSTIHLRPARQEDIPTLKLFEQGVIDAERPYDQSLKQETFYYYDLGQLIASDHSLLIVACDGDQIVGSGYAQLRAAKDYQTFETYAYLGFMYVVPEHRGRRINQMIISSLKNWSLSKGVRQMKLEVYAGNVPAIKAYEKAGFKANLVEMAMSL